MNEYSIKWTPRPTSRIPPEETTDLYPGLCVHDGRVGGSITVSRSRLSLSTVVLFALEYGWDSVMQIWGNIETEYGWAKADLTNFLRDLTEPRGEFGRLLLILAEVERQASSRDEEPSWYEHPDLRGRVREQLARCIDVLDRIDSTPTPETEE